MSNKEASILEGLMAAIAAFPAQMVLRNNTWREHIDPETRTVVGPYSQAEVVIANADQLARVVSNTDQLNVINEWPEPAGLFIETPGMAAAAAVQVAATPSADAPVKAAAAKAKK